MKKYLTLSNGIYGVTILFALGVLLKITIDKARLPAGVCPTAYNNDLIVFSISLLVVGTIVTSLLDRKAKKKKLEDKTEAHQ